MRRCNTGRFAYIVGMIFFLIHPAFAHPQGQSPPAPPGQTASVPIPAGNATEPLPSPLTDAVAVLFAQGLPDPRGCEYRAITILAETSLFEPLTIATHGWLLPPARDDRRFAICWNGLIYPIISIQETASLADDARELVAQQKPSLNQQLTFGPLSIVAPASSVSPRSLRLLKMAFLLRLEEFGPANALYKMVMPDEGYNVNDSVTARKDPYLHLAMQWSWALYNRALGAHLNGEDAQALADTDLLLKLQPLIEAEAVKRGYESVPDSGSIHTPGEPYLPFLQNLQELHSDTKRRLREPAQPPLDLQRLNRLPRQQRIAELVRRLDQLDTRQQSIPGSVSFDRTEILQALIAEGDAAVSPLIDVLESDTRLTRSFDCGRPWWLERRLIPVTSAAYQAIVHIIGRTDIPGPDQIADLQQWWATHQQHSH